MIFSDLSAGDSIFLDANTLTYHFQPHPVFGLPCTGLLEHVSSAYSSAAAYAGRSIPRQIKGAPTPAQVPK